MLALRGRFALSGVLEAQATFDEEILALGEAICRLVEKGLIVAPVDLLRCVAGLAAHPSRQISGETSCNIFRSST